MTVLLILNTLAALLSVGFAAFAAVRPAAMGGSESITAAERFFAYMYAARAVPFGVVAAVLPWFERGVGVAWFLFVAAAIQLIDVGIGIWRKEGGLIGGGAVLAAIHVIAGIAVL
ncbi:MAG TPA: hypothetical protein VFV67_23575 [Actinophytocola sp.]|uniref:hypothetical protein n=1 Tax=Actinophytocola sp. TaxID=1872138 RepID=UPI002DBD1C26|nr:hypothetical protein [Actinophytocola sp.]HEU5473639.1 hypothetical protein [Actinophytocola sp.]